MDLLKHDRLPNTPVASPFVNATPPYSQTSIIINKCSVNFAEGEHISMSHLLSLDKIKVPVLGLTVLHVIKKLPRL